VDETQYNLNDDEELAMPVANNSRDIESSLVFD
jgi:hypothetical protein